MSASAVVASILLVIGLAVVVASCLGVAVMDDPLDRLHLVTPAATLGVSAVCAAAVCRTGLSASGLAAILVAVFVAGTSPFVGHAVARSILVRRSAEQREGDASR